MRADIILQVRIEFVNDKTIDQDVLRASHSSGTYPGDRLEKVNNLIYPWKTARFGTLFSAMSFAPDRQNWELLDASPLTLENMSFVLLLDYETPNRGTRTY